MGKKCLKCGYERMPLDDAPEYECPKCGAIYAKVEAAIKRKNEEIKASREKRRFGIKEFLYSKIENRLHSNQGIKTNKKLSKCKTCGKEVSKTAKTCPHCGEKKPASSKSHTGLSIFIGVLIISSILGEFHGSDTETNTSFNTETNNISFKSHIELRNDPSRSLILQQYLERNFAVPGFVASWYPNILSVKVIGMVAVIETDLTRGNNKISDICGAVSWFIYSNDKYDISQVKVVSPYGATLLHRASVFEKCSPL